MLNKQKILSELGNVVNQLQSADCGCMGKLFSSSGKPDNNANMAMTAAGGCCQPGGCCHGHACHGYNSPCAGEPCQAPRHCMGSCNPSKLYADTYGYLNQNLMQPVVNEVCNDLKSLTPENTMINSPMAAQMGLPLGGNPMLRSGNMAGNIPSDNMANNMGAAMTPYQGPGRAILGMGSNSASGHMPQWHFEQPQVDNTNMSNQNNMQNNSSSNQQMGQMERPMGNMMGMGPQIVNMMQGDSARFGNQHQQPNSMGDIPQTQNTRHINATENISDRQYNMGRTASNPAQYNAGSMGIQRMGIHNQGQGNQSNPMQNSNMQPTNINQPNMNERAYPNAYGNMMNGNSGFQSVQNMKTNPTQQQMSSRNAYGQHNAGIAKFNEMFPGVLQGNLGFDPMAIAIQMNPANQQRAAMNTMQNMMNNNASGINKMMDSNNASLMQPVINATNAATAQLAHANQLQQNEGPGQQGIISGDGNNFSSQQANTVAGAPVMNQQYRPQIMETSRSAVTINLPTVYEGSGGSEALPEQLQTTPPTPASNQDYKEPLLPADTSKSLPPQLATRPQKYYYYNTLGQPVEMVPADIYRPEIPNLPQTLSPQPTKPNYSNVKYTVSKTSLMGKRAIGKVPSRNQLQNIYNQYKGSQSYTQQFVKPTAHGSSYSEGNLNAPQTNVRQNLPVEKVGGDSAANNNVKSPDTETVKAQVDDASKPPMEGEKHASLKKTRNGLQDVVFTSYPTSAAWSFHGKR